MHISLADFILWTLRLAVSSRQRSLIWLASCFFPRRLYERSLHICASFHINILPSTQKLMIWREKNCLFPVGLNWKVFLCDSQPFSSVIPTLASGLSYKEFCRIFFLNMGPLFLLNYIAERSGEGSSGEPSADAEDKWIISAAPPFLLHSKLFFNGWFQARFDSRLALVSWYNYRCLSFFFFWSVYIPK